MRFIVSSLLSILCSSLLAGPPTTINWLSPVDVSIPGDDQSLALNDNNQAVSVWRWHRSANDIVQASLFTNNVWSSPLNLSEGGKDIRSPAVAMNNNNQAIAVWPRKNDGSVYTIQSSIYNGSSWSSPSNLSVAGSEATNPQVALNNIRLGIAAWEIVLPSDTNHTIQVSTYNGSTWSTPTSISPEGQDCHSPQIAINDSGTAILAWYNASGTHSVIQVAFYNRGVWSSPYTITDGTEDGTSPSVALNELGHAVLMWRMGAVAHPYVIQGAFYNGSSWTFLENPSTHENTLSLGNDAAAPTVSLNDFDQAVGIWQTAGAGPQIIIEAAKIEGPTVISINTLSDTSANATNGYVSINNSGFAVAVWKWEYLSGKFVMQSSFYDTEGWNTTVNLSSTGGGTAQTPLVAFLNKNQLAVVIWKYEPLGGSVNGVQAIANVAAPTDIIGAQKTNKFVFETAFFNRITWLPSTLDGVTIYYVYRDDTLIGSVSGLLQFDDYMIDPNIRYTYAVTAVSTTGTESLPIQTGTP